MWFWQTYKFQIFPITHLTDRLVGCVEGFRNLNLFLFLFVTKWLDFNSHVPSRQKRYISKICWINSAITHPQLAGYLTSRFNIRFFVQKILGKVIVLNWPFFVWIDISFPVLIGQLIENEIWIFPTIIDVRIISESSSLSDFPNEILCRRENSRKENY